MIFAHMTASFYNVEERRSYYTPPETFACQYRKEGNQATQKVESA